MNETFEFTLNNPLTEEQWDMIADVDMEHTDSVTFHTKHGKEVEFAKVIRCKDCKHKNEYGYCTVYLSFHHLTADMDYCSDAERKEE